MNHPDFPLWRFSLAFYRRPGVERACLALQDGWGADVNMLLFCCWAGIEEGAPLDAARIERAMAAVAQWQARVVAPLRALRRQLKAGFDGLAQADAEDLRRRVVALELDAEYLAQRLIGASVTLQPAGAGDGGAAVAANLENYLRLAGVEQGPALRHCLRVLIDAAARGGGWEQR